MFKPLTLLKESKYTPFSSRKALVSATSCVSPRANLTAALVSKK